MKPFDLEKALAGDPVVCRDGTPVTEIYRFHTSDQEFKVRAVVRRTISSFSDSGRYYYGDTESESDLFMAPVKRQGWVNIYKHAVAGLFDSKQDAIDSATSECVATVPVEWEE